MKIIQSGSSREGNGRFAPTVPPLSEFIVRRRKGEYFDWNTFLNRAVCTQKDFNNAQRLAGDFVTCACGSLCNALPREVGMPLDDKLRSLGYSFYIALLNTHVREAKKILLEIEERASEVLESQEIYYN